MLRRSYSAAILALACVAGSGMATDRAPAWKNAPWSVGNAIVLPAYVEPMIEVVKARWNDRRTRVVTSDHAPHGDSDALVRICAPAERRRTTLSEVGMRSANAPRDVRQLATRPSTTCA